MQKQKRLGLVAHDARKKDLLDWVAFNATRLAGHSMVCTGTTGHLIGQLYKEKYPKLTPTIQCLASGPLGGDQQMGALITEGAIDILVFLTDPMTTQPHDVDVKALVRLCTVYNTVVACTRSTADFIISSPLFDQEYIATKQNYAAYLEREVYHGKKNTK